MSKRYQTFTTPKILPTRGPSPLCLGLNLFFGNRCDFRENDMSPYSRAAAMCVRAGRQDGFLFIFFPFTSTTTAYHSLVGYRCAFLTAISANVSAKRVTDRVRIAVLEEQQRLLYTRVRRAHSVPRGWPTVIYLLIFFTLRRRRARRRMLRGFFCYFFTFFFIVFTDDVEACGGSRLHALIRHGHACVPKPTTRRVIINITTIESVGPRA